MTNDNWYRSRSLFPPPSRPKPPKRMRRVFHVVRTALRRTCTVLGAMMLVSALIGAVLSSFAVSEVKSPSLPGAMVLVLTLDGDLEEHRDVAGYGFGDRTPTIREVVDALDRAGRDKRVKGFVIRLDSGGVNLAHVAELRAAVDRFRATGRFAYIYGASYEGMGTYALASAFDQVWLQPMGIVSVPGVRAEVPFARELLDKIGVEPQIFARKEYKNFFESATSREMSQASREMTRALVEDIGAGLADTIAAGRGTDRRAIDALIDRGLFTGDEALAAGLVDRLDFSDTLSEEIRGQVTGDPEGDSDLFASMDAYIKEPPPFTGVPVKKPKAALVYIVGEIVQHGGAGGGSLAVADALVDDLRDAADDEDIKTVVIRVDSPGGSPAASEAIRRAIVHVKEKGKTVIVSMGASAASGGYWIIADADRIFALPGTLTGSIGVTGGKFSLAGLWEKAGINWDSVSVGENSGIWSFNAPYSPAEAERMNAMMDDVYNGFVARVAAGRKLSAEQAESIAKGRVWTGRQALERGLVDDLGGLDAALDYAASLLEVKDRTGLHVVVMPRPMSAFEKVVNLLERQVRIVSFLDTQGRDILRAADRNRDGLSLYAPLTVR